MSSKNSNYAAAESYLTFQHNEYTGLPILDEKGRPKLRDSYLLDTLECGESSFAMACLIANRKYGKNGRREDVKTHHYIVSFDPKDAVENGLTMEKAQALGLQFCKDNFPGHPAIVCTHPDGHNSAGNIHVHIVIGSLRVRTVERQPFMDKPCDWEAGKKHRCTSAMLRHLRVAVMEMCEQADLNQINLLEAQGDHVSEREYWAQRRGQRRLDHANAKLAAEGQQPTQTVYQTELDKLRKVLDALRIETYTPEWKPQLDRIHLQNGTYFLDERGFVPEKELCLNRLPVEYQPDAPAPTKWLEFLDGLLIPEDILTLQEYLGYLLIPSTKAQKMLVMTGKGGEGKSRIGLLLKKLFGEASHSESILRIETNRFASANLEYKLVMVDDDLNMVALPETRNIKSIVTAEDRLCIERKNKQAVQGLLYVRFICFGNGNLVAAHDDSDGFWRRQILITVKDRDPARVDNPFLIEELSEERPGILLWMLEGLHRLLANRYQFTISERSIQNLEAAMADSDNLTQFMQATAYVRFKPDTEERSTYLYRAYTKWCEDNLESPVPQKKFSQFLLKNAGKYGLTFSKHIEGKYRGFRGVCVHPAFAAA